MKYQTNRKLGRKKILFIVNTGSGNKDLDINSIIANFSAENNVETEQYSLPEKIDKLKIKQAVAGFKPDIVAAIGGDGTVKLVAEQLVGSNIQLAIIPAGSANGMAKELGIPNDPQLAFDLILNGSPIQIHLVKINDEICIHLADMGFNAYLVQKFDSLPQRGMWAYTKAAFHALANHKRMDVEITIKGEKTCSKAAMVAIANATKYGTGLKINPDGKLDDELFEVILVKDYSYLEILKMWVTNLPVNPDKIEVFQTKELKITSKHKAHFQVDGEYLG
ncbi:MAG: diacylglycerol kinase family lipid kinase, partial [Pedobacter sp.]